MEAYKENGIDKAPHYLDNEFRHADLVALYERAGEMDYSALCQWIRANQEQFSADTLVLEKGDVKLLEDLAIQPDLIICLQPFNDFRHFNDFLVKANKVLKGGGEIAINGETSGMRRHRILQNYPKGINHIIEVLDFVWSRIMSKLALTRKLYLIIVRGRHRNFSRVEVLGRLAKAGFCICGDEIHQDVFYASAIKQREPITTKPYYGLFVKLPRKGKDGKIIKVYKLRTMYAYAEYIQDYTYKINGLEQGGKLKDDFRINLLGAFFRSHFIDELPMFINFFKGELKFVGVRPISEHYLSLYTPEMQQLHLSVKPGIFPPLYYEYPKPKTLEEIQESERRYIESYKKHPFRTDWIYFWGMVRNIVFRHERSH